jgi:hypothetical protein
MAVQAQKRMWQQVRPILSLVKKKKLVRWAASKKRNLMKA